MEKEAIYPPACRKLPIDDSNIYGLAEILNECKNITYLVPSRTENEYFLVRAISCCSANIKVVRHLGYIYTGTNRIR